MRDDADVGNIYFCQIVRQQASHTSGCCEIPGWSTTMLHFNNNLYTWNIYVKMYFWYNQARWALWSHGKPTAFLKMLRFRVEEFIKDQSKNMVTSKPSLGLPQKFKMLFPVFSKKCSSIVTAAKNHSLGCAPAKSTGGFRGPLSVFDFGDPFRAFALGVESNFQQTRNGSVTVKLKKHPPKLVVVRPHPKKKPTPTFGDPVANLKRMWARISKKVCM